MRRGASFSAAILLLLGLAALGDGCGAAASVAVTGLRCEYLEHPLGVDVPQPRFSWLITSTRRGVSQSAYRILVASTRDRLEADRADLWDSGRVAAGDAVNIAYAGSSLESGTTYYWKVRVWDEGGGGSAWSEVTSFHTGMLNDSDWTARWIAAADGSTCAPMLRKAFRVEKEVRRAFAYVTGVGYYELYLNGRKVSQDVLTPAVTDYRKRVLYNTYDVTELLVRGDNAAGILLGDGAFRLPPPGERYGSVFRAHDFGAPRALLHLAITFADGSRGSVVTDGSWRWAAGPITYNHFYGGEDYDARREQPGWSSASFEAQGWQPVRVVPGPQGALKAQLMPASRVTETIQPVASAHPEPGVWVFDLGQNIPGWWRIQVRAEAGARVRVWAAETLNGSPFPRPLEAGDRLGTDQPYHSAVWTTYTAKGAGEEVYEPRFFYTGFRYLEATVDPPAAVQSLRVEGRVVHTALAPGGTFSTSEEMLNSIHMAAVWAQIGNTHGYPTDSPHREKGGYTGDGQLVAESAMHDFDMAAFYTKWMDDMEDAQEDDGRIPNTAPTLVGGSGGGVAWGSAYILLPWWMYNYYTDHRVLEEHYPGMQRYLRYLEHLARTDSDPGEAYIINDFGGYWDSLGEWCAPGQRDGPNHPVVSTYYYYLDAALMARIARALGQAADADAYDVLADHVRQAFLAKFYDPHSHLLGSEKAPFQTYQLLALAGGLVPRGDVGAVLETVVNDVMRTRDGHLNTGIIGTKYLWPVLVEGGRGDVAYAVVTRATYPGYGYWITNGATTLWESWAGESSHNHQVFGSVEEYFYKYLAGIRAPGQGGTTRGYRRILIRPDVPAGLREVRARLDTVAGTVSSHWWQGDGRFRLVVRIPANSTALVSVPLRRLDEAVIKEGRTTVWEGRRFRPGAEGVGGASLDGSYVTFRVASGRYVFTATE